MKVKKSVTLFQRVREPASRDSEIINDSWNVVTRNRANPSSMTEQPRPNQELQEFIPAQD